jgi:hypothetical protein
VQEKTSHLATFWQPKMADFPKSDRLDFRRLAFVTGKEVVCHLDKEERRRPIIRDNQSQFTHRSAQRHVEQAAMMWLITAPLAPGVSARTLKKYWPGV